MIRQAALVICSSRAEQQLVVRDFGGDLPVIVVPHGVDVEQFVDAEPFPDLPGTTILTGGRLEGYKQIDVVVRAMAHLDPDHHLYIFGDGPARSDLEALAGVSPAAERIHVLGKVPADELRRWFRSAAVFVSLSREEAYGLTMIEGVAAGAALVVSDIPAYREMAEGLPGQRVDLVPIEAGGEEVAAAIRRATAGPRRTPGDLSGLPTWAAMVDQIGAGYRAVLQGRRAAASTASRT